MEGQELDLSKVVVLSFGGVDRSDSPDYCDAYIEEALYEGRELSEEEIESLNEDHLFVHERLMDFLF